MKAINNIIERQRTFSPNSYIELFAADDKKKSPQIFLEHFKVSEVIINKLIDDAEIKNTGSLSPFINLNPLSNPKRIKDNVLKVLYIFIDLDDANEDHNDLIKTTLDNYKITYCYNCKSGHGFHFLIPVYLDTDKEQNVKKFLTYLKEKVCNCVDVSTYTNERLIRFPESIHKKDDEEKQLITLHTHLPSKEEITSNSKLLFKYQYENKIKSRDIEYQNNIKIEDNFFSTILNSPTQWSKYYKLLNSAKDRHENFIKNMGYFCYHYPDQLSNCEAFLNNWEPTRITAVKNWKKKAQTYKTPILYHELKKWSECNNLDEFTKMLEIQTRKTFLDKYEIYYLDDEKKESAYLIYYPEKDYFVQKSLNEVLQTIYYSAKEDGFDLVQELGLILIEDWDDFTFKKQLGMIFNNIHKKLEEENRIKKVFNINYEPTESKYVYHFKKKYFNTYNKTELWDVHEKKEKYNFKNIKELIMNLVGDDKDSYNYFNKWLGWQILNPTEKLPTAIIFQGRQGSGKGTFKNLILDNIFGSNCQEINQTHLESSFNEYLMGKQIIVANEVMHNENRQVLPNILKNLVTDEYITISRKFRKEIVCRNYTHWIFCTNSDNPIKIDGDDRRYNVFQSDKLKGGGKPAAKFVQNLKKNLEKELPKYISYLKSLKISFDEIHEPIMTQAKLDIIELNKDSIERFVEYVKQFHDFKTCIYSFNNKEYSYCELEVNNLKFISTDIVYLAYESYCNKFKERGLFNKQTFSKKISLKGLQNKSIYFPNSQSSKRVYDVEELQKVFLEGVN